MTKLPTHAIPDDLSLDDDAAATEIEMGQIVHRPDGYHWQAPDGKNEFGPFETLELAVADMQSANPDAPEPGESLQEAEDEIGLADWIDPDTGELAEGMTTPHLNDE